MIPVVVGDTCKECGSVDKLKDGAVARRFLASHPSLGKSGFSPYVKHSLPNYLLA